MKNTLLARAIAFGLTFTLPALGGTLYVDVNSASPVPPYASWATAATTIQQAVDAASTGDEIVVTNGIYQTGGSLANGSLTNRVSVTKPVTVRSVNGPAVTMIVGYQVPGSIYGNDAIRCVYLTNGASLFGFTITNGSTVDAWSEPPINVIGGGGVYCESPSAIVSNCIVLGNAAGAGGGVYSGTLKNCGLVANTSSGYGGGASDSTLLNCWVTRNRAVWGGGGAMGGMLNNCTVTDNFPNGVDLSIVTNSIVYYNLPENYSTSYDITTLDYCCTTPLPLKGAGNISTEPLLSSASHLSAGSSCRGAGSLPAASGVDIDGDTWANPPSMGCDEFHPGTITGPLAVTMQATVTNVAVGFSVGFTANIEGRTSASRWDFAGGTILSNHPFATSHSWSAPGDYAVVLTAYNESFPGGVSATGIVHVVEENHYVSLSSVNPVPPYSSWATAATNIQDAVDVAVLPGALVLVSNGVYATGARVVHGSMTNRVVVNRPVMVRSANGPVVTTIQGYQLPGTTNGDGAIRCVYLTNNATLSGFTLGGGATRAEGDGVLEQSGGGVLCESSSAVVSNCVITGNAAAYTGGGASRGTLVNCVLTTNQAWIGGALYVATANTCTIANNMAGDQGGGVYEARLNNCTIQGNYAPNTGGGLIASRASNSVLADNVSTYGGGAQDSILQSCLLTNNSASGAGGGVNGGTLISCTLTGNTTPGYGGGANSATLNFCWLTDNTASVSGGGANSCNLNSCTISDNYAGSSGGAATGGTLNNCVITDNTAASSGGGVYGATLNNCTLSANSAPIGGGVHDSTLNNCILFYNTASRGQNYYGGSLNYCCTTPVPTSGVGNIAVEPQLAGPAHLSANSPCRAAGSAAYTTGKDIDGEAWLNPPSIGCDEFYSGSVTGALSVAILPAYTNIATGYADNFAAHITGHPTASRWEFGDGTIVSNQPNAAHSWTLPGDYDVVLRAYNTSNPGGVSATVTVHVVAQPVHYVALSNNNPVAPFTSWATAATNIQDAVNAATLPGALVLVTNGTYQSGGQAVFGAMTNRVVINKPVLVQSVNGPAVTIIRGTPTNSDSAVRCAYVSSGATLSGFTLMRGATRADGDGDREQCGGAAWLESASAVLTNCVLTANTANNAGGAVAGGTLINCTLATNSAPHGGATYLSELYQCTLTRNVATGDSGGAAHTATLNHCTITANAAINTGGGAYGSTLNNCTLSGNSATNYGGGANASALNNCVLFGNSSGAYGGGAEGGVLNNCTLTGNSALNGGGTHSSTVNNSILFYNSAPIEPNYSGGDLNYCCTTPPPPAGTGNISADPQLAGLAHLSSGSPCRNAGSASYVNGADIDGEAWANPPSIGCDEYRVGALTGSLSVAIQAPQTSLAVGFVANFTAQINGRISDSRWEFGDGTIVSNQPYASHAWAAPGNYLVVFRAYNESNPGGITATVGVQVVTQPIHYVRASGSTPVAPYTSWITAANNIQSALDVASVAGAMVLVSNGTYQTGGRVIIEATNRVAVTKPLLVRSVNGPAVTTIDGGGALRCVYLVGGAVLSGFTLANGVVGEMVDSSERNGGGGRCASLSALITNCVVTGCSGTGGGGGVFSGTLNDCMFLSNSAYAGGAASGSTLNDCTLIGNGAWYGGGVDWCLLNRCTLTANTGGNGGAANNATLNFCQLTNNTAQYWGGGAINGTLVNCTLIGNHANSGGAALDATLRNCLLYANSAGHGGGTVGGTLYNCTVTGNAAGSGGGADGSALNNCIVYYNDAPIDSNYTASCTLNYSSASPPPTSGVGNLAANPQLASLTRLSAASPCRGAGSATYVNGVDIDGEAWLNPPSMGCDEFYSGGLTGLVSVALQASSTNVATGFPIHFNSQINGLVTASRWEFGDGTIVSNQPIVMHSWLAAGDYNVVLRAYNETYPTGITATVTIHVLVAPVQYVSLQNPNPFAPYLSWATAATNIQDALDAGYAGGTLIVSNGTYAVGSRVVSGETNRVAVVRPMTLLSVGGPAVTVINGAQTMRGIYLAAGSTLRGFTVTNSSTPGHGGGIYCESSTVIVTNCVLAGNSAAGQGGGINRGTLSNCELRNNSASDGGGASGATLSQCLVANNSAGGSGSGLSSCTATNCVIFGNSGAQYGGGVAGSTVFNSTVTGNNGFRGGGANSSTLINCLVANNLGWYGGGAYTATLNGCTVVGNAAFYGGGVRGGNVNNSIVYYNTYRSDGSVQNWVWGWPFPSLYFNNSCTTPMPPLWWGNFTEAPNFVNQAGGNYRLQPNSPCINTGNSGYVAAGETDLDGNRRIMGSAVDVGAYEFISADALAFNQWLQSYGLPVDGSADYIDNDSDGMNNWQEYIAGTIPTGSNSVLRMLPPASDTNGVIVSWQSVATRNYFLQRGINLVTQPAFSTIQSNIVGQAGVTTYTDTNATNGGPFYYRVGVQ